MRPSFAKLPKPFLVSVIREANPLDAISTIMNSEYDGADAYDLHINALEKKYHDYDSLRKIITSTTRPVLLLNYRSEVHKTTDEERLAEQITGIKAGAAGIDMIGDLFDDDRVPMTPAEMTAYSLNRDAEPLELSMKPDVIRRQKEAIEEIHSMGAEVLLSSHTRVVMNAERVIPLALEMESRGPDMVKIVTVCLNEDDLLEAFRTTVALRKVMKVPFQYQCHGQNSKLLRVVGPMLGSMLIFCNQKYKPQTHTEQPLLRSMKLVLQNVDWRVRDDLDETFSKT